MEEVVQKVVSGIASKSAGALRVVSVGANVAGTLLGDRRLIAVGQAAGTLSSFLSADDGGAGATVEDSASTAAGQASNAPNQEDTTVAPAPQLSETTDPVGETRPEVPESEFEPGLQNRFYDPLNSPDSLLDEFFRNWNAEQDMDWDSEEIEEMMNRITNQILNARRLVVGGDSSQINVDQKSKKLKSGKFVPV